MQLPYGDGGEEDWFYGAVCWARQLGILPDGELLRPNARLTRETLIAGLYAWAVNTGRSEAIVEGESTLSQLRACLSERGLCPEAVSPEALAWAS